MVVGWLLIGMLSSGCAATPLTSLRFENRAPVWRVDDRRPIPLPAESPPTDWMKGVNAYLGEILHDMSVPPPVLAKNINSLGEVPDSTWFENRIGRHPLAPERLVRGPGGTGPDLSMPWTIIKGKNIGVSPGFIIEDGRGERYLIKLDPGAPEAETGAEVVAQRLLWAAGYNVPDNQVVEFERTSLRIAPNTTYRTSLGGKLPFGVRELEATLSRGPPPVAGEDGRLRYRAMASKYLDGVPVGGFPMLGVRRDDANDRVAHEHRRDVRGQAYFFGWLGHTDIKQPNTLDMWIELEPGSGRGYLRHFLLDFGKALGTWGREGTHEHDGWSTHFDYRYAIASMLALGLWERPWEDVRWPELRGVGRFEAVSFEAGHYSPANLYPPFLYTDRFDEYWAAKIIARFTPSHIANAVAQGRYTDPRATAYLTATLIARQRKVLRYAFKRVGPVDHFRIERRDGAARLCGTDLALRYGLSDPSVTRYRIEAYDWNGRATGFRRDLLAQEDGEFCTEAPTGGTDHDGYTMVLVEAVRGEEQAPPVIAHLARAPGAATLRVVGIQRR